MGGPRHRRHNGGVHAAALRFDLHVPESRSLKVKRAAVLEHFAAEVEALYRS